MTRDSPLLMSGQDKMEAASPPNFIKETQLNVALLEDLLTLEDAVPLEDPE